METCILHRMGTFRAWSANRRTHTRGPLGILRAGGDAENQQRVRDQLRHAIEDRRFRLIILDRQDPWLQPSLDQNYRLRGPALESDGLWTRTGLPHPGHGGSTN